MRYLKLFETFDVGISPKEAQWATETIPAAEHSWKAPGDELYRWLVPGDSMEYFKGDLEQSGIEDHCQDDEGNQVKCTGIPFFIENHFFFGYGEPFCRIILDKSKLLDDGYTLFNPHRDEGERRIKEDIKDWMKYLIAFEVNRDEFDLKWDEEYEDYAREFPIPFEERKKMWEAIIKAVPKDKLKIVDDEWYMENTNW